MNDARAGTRAAVLAGSINAADIAASDVEIQRPAIYRHIGGIHAPLDLNALRFLYAVRLDGSVVPVREAARRCHDSHARRR